MSREFGSCSSGYFHQQIENAASDCLNGKDDLTRLWGEFFREFEPVAYAIATSEACDSDVSYSIKENLRHIAKLKSALDSIDAYLKPFGRVADDAVREYINRQKIVE